MSINESQFQDLLDRYLKGTATAEEARVLDEFFNSYKQGELPDKLSLSDERTRSEIFHHIEARTGQTGSTGLKTVLKVAAAIALLIVGYSIFQIQLNRKNEDRQIVAVEIITEQTRRGEKSSLELPDGTVVHLNANSSISYSPSFKQARQVKLSGEAYFEVTHDAEHPFEVSAASSTVKVLGTSFNVKTTGTKAVEVTLVKGKVNVGSWSDAAILEPGFQAVVQNDNDSIVTRKVNTERYTSWKENILFFEQTSLSEASQILEDWYDTKINIQSAALSKCVITGQYKNESLENVLKSFEFLLNASVDYKDLKNISIRGQGCKTTIN